MASAATGDCESHKTEVKSKQNHIKGVVTSRIHKDLVPKLKSSIHASLLSGNRLEMLWKRLETVWGWFAINTQAYAAWIVVCKMRFDIPDGTLSLVVFDCYNGVLIVADKYLIQIHHLAELAFSFRKHQKFPKSNEWARRYLDSRALAFFFKC